MTVAKKAEPGTSLSFPLGFSNSIQLWVKYHSFNARQTSKVTFLSAYRVPLESPQPLNSQATLPRPALTWSFAFSRCSVQAQGLFCCTQFKQNSRGITNRQTDRQKSPLTSVLTDHNQRSGKPRKHRFISRTTL